MADPPAPCAVCGATLRAGAHYVARIDVFADPAVEPVDDQTFGPDGAGAAVADLLEQMKAMTADELMDGVHRRFEYALCPACHKRFLANPLGLPRGTRPGVN